jgi:hypothetical protein
VPKATIRSHRLSSLFYTNTDGMLPVLLYMLIWKKVKSVFFLCLCSDVNESIERKRERPYINTLILPPIINFDRSKNKKKEIKLKSIYYSFFFVLNTCVHHCRQSSKSFSSFFIWITLMISFYITSKPAIPVTHSIMLFPLIWFG